MSSSGRRGERAAPKFIRLYLAYIAFQMKISRDPMTLARWNPRSSVKTNRLAMRFDVSRSSTQAVLLMIALLGGRLLLYYWAMIVVLNGMMFTFPGPVGRGSEVRSLAAEASK